MDIRKTLTERFNKQICRVLGFARSNKPLVSLLCDAGAHVIVHDRNENIAKDEKYNEFKNRGVEFEIGEGYLEKGLRGDHIFRSPAFRPDIPSIADAVNNGAELSSEMELFFEICPCSIIGITGSDGKTTTTTLTHLFLDTEFRKEGKGRRAYIGGNIGSPLLPLVFEMTEQDVAVVELSSFQLMTMKLSPKRALITNVTPNHLNWHTDMDEYIGAKCNIFWNRGAEMLVANSENGVTREIAKNCDLPLTYFSSKMSSYADIVPYFKQNAKAIYENNGSIYLDDGKTTKEILKTADILIPGRHNVENYMAAIALTEGYVTADTVRGVARTFGGVEHRLELVREIKGVKFYNSSIDSSPTRTAAALSALDTTPIIICGGSEKGVEFDTLAIDLCEKTKAVVLTGDAAKTILSAIEKCPLYDREKLTVKHIPDFDEAVKTAATLATHGDTVLLSPACASFDHFRDFAHRGNYFKNIVNRL